eukprot:gene5395-5933_t
MPEQHPHQNGHHGPGLSFWVTVAFTLNYSVGSGFLTLPWAFSQTGILIGILVLLLFGFYSMLATFFLLETIDRGRKVLELSNNHLTSQAFDKKNYVSIGETPINPILADDTISAVEMISPSGRTPPQHVLQHGGGGEEVVDPEMTFADPDDFEINNHVRKLEINELCEIFLGPNGKLIFTLLIMIYVTGTLWAYGTVFANAFAAHLNIGSYSYYIYLFLFACMVIPASLLEFSEQVSVQVALSFFRVLMVFVMCLTTLFASSSDSNDFALTESQSSGESIWQKVDWYNIYTLLPVAAYAYIFHHSVPSLEYPVREKKSMINLFSTAIVISMVLYILVGAVVSAYFGDQTDQSSNLNWEKYHGPNGNLWLGRLIAFFVVIFPAFDVASAFPLNAYTLGNTLMTAFYGKAIESNDHAGGNLRIKLQLCRGLAAGLPLLGALIDHNLGHITDYTGLAAFVLAFIFPPLLAYASDRRLKELGINYTSIHSSFVTGIAFQALLLISGISSLLFVGVALIKSESKSE